VVLLASLGFGLEAVLFEQCKSTAETWWVVPLDSLEFVFCVEGLLKTVCPSRQGEGVSFSR
jgi:hypothetical protein